MKNIRDLTKIELNNYLDSLGEPRYRLKQIFNWLHKSIVYDMAEMTNVSKKLLSQIESDFLVDFPIIKEEFISKKDETRKYLIKLTDGNIIETVLMKYKYGFSICISSQVGCNMGCKFCASGMNGLLRNLSVYELLAQVYLVSKHIDKHISNIVIMGTGEPLNNFDNIIKFLNIINDEEGQNISLRNITISTCGIVNNIYKLADMKMPINIALSLHASNDDIRRSIMPISKKYTIVELIDSMYYYYTMTGRRVTFEYSLIDNVNDSKECAEELANLLKDRYKNKQMDYLVNLIPINKVKGLSYDTPKDGRIYRFKDILEKNKIDVTIRRELGSDISGSCGQLRAKFIK